MTLMGKIGALSPKTLLEQGELDEVLEKKRRTYDAAVRPARLKIARGNLKWTEIENDLFPRNQVHWLVSASTDAIYTPVRVWSSSRTR